MGFVANSISFLVVKEFYFEDTLSFGQVPLVKPCEFFETQCIYAYIKNSVRYCVIAYVAKLSLSFLEDGILQQNTHHFCILAALSSSHSHIASFWVYNAYWHQEMVSLAYISIVSRWSFCTKAGLLYTWLYLWFPKITHVAYIMSLYIYTYYDYLWPPYEIGGPLYFCPVVTIFLSIYLSIFFISSPNLSGRRLNVYHTSTHGVALVRI